MVVTMYDKVGRFCDILQNGKRDEGSGGVHCWTRML